MSVAFHHRHDRALVSFAGELSWETGLDLVYTIDLVIDVYFYSVVELVVTSPGGNLAALRFVCDALARRRAQGVRFHTRVISRASSAAALLVCLGDERVANAGALLLFHRSRAINVDAISAHETAELLAALSRTDEGWLVALADRALASAPGPARVHDAERADRKVLELLWPEIRPARTKGTPRKLRRLIRALGRTVERAVCEGDRDTLGRLYRHLFDTERAVSAKLALTLCLIDCVDPVLSAAVASSAPPGLVVSQWRVLFPPHGEIPRDTLTRHTLVLGETGSGKTASCILPMVAAMARAPADRLGAALVIDPKREIGSVLADVASSRLHHVSADTAVLHLMAGSRWTLDPDLGARRWLSAATRILCRVASFVPSNPARVLMVHSPGQPNEDFFQREGTSLALCVLAVVLMLTSRHLPDPQSWLEHDVEAFSWVDDLRQRAFGEGDSPGPNLVALAAWALDGPLLMTGSAAPYADQSTWLFGRIARAALPLLASDDREAHDVVSRVIDYWGPMSDVGPQFAGVRASARVVCADFAAPSIAHTLYFGCEPGYLASVHNGVDFRRAVAREGGGPLVLFQPARDGQDNLVAIALKAAFFEAVLDDPDRARGGADLPLVGYVADEFHRFVTSDPLHGEQSFLDTCRSFGAFCVLACQSVASIEHALAHGGGTHAQNESAVSILWNNTANKLIFRSTDPKTADRVSDLCPHRPGLAGVVRVRPVSTLAPGECYAMLADGRFERRQLEPFRGAESQKSGESAHGEIAAVPQSGAVAC